MLWEDKSSTIEVLPGELILEIFIFYKLACPSRGSIWSREWHNLAHVCQQWRTIIYASQQRLDLRLLCTPKTSIKRTLDLWPAFPIVLTVQHTSSLDNWYNTFTMLQQHDRVCEIDLDCSLFRSRVSKAIRIMQEPFPLLERIVLKSGGCFESTDTLLGGSAPRLHVLHLDVCGQISDLNPFQLPLIISSAGRLVDLRLEQVPYNEHTSPKAIVAALSTMVQLKYFHLKFLPYYDTTTLPPSFGGIVSSTIIHLTFGGPCHYLEDLLSRISTKSLESMCLKLFNPDSSFDAFKLSQFLNRIELQSLPCRAEMGYGSYGSRSYLSFTRSVALPEGKSKRSKWLSLELDFPSSFNEQLSQMTQICQQISPFLSDVRALSLPMRDGSYGLWRDGDRHWVDFLRQFDHVEELHLSGTSNIFSPISRRLKFILANNVLPAMRELSLDPDLCLIKESSKESWDNIMSFIDARDLVGLPITVTFT